MRLRAAIAFIALFPVGASSGMSETLEGSFPIEFPSLSSISEQVLVNKVKFLFKAFDDDGDHYVSRKELETLIMLTSLDASPEPFADVFGEFCDTLGANRSEGLTLSQLTQAYRLGYGDVESDWMVLFEGRDGFEVLECDELSVEGVPTYQYLLNGRYQRNGLQNGRPYFKTIEDERILDNSTRFLYWTPAYDGGWLLDDDLKDQSSNAFLSSQNGRMAGTWAVAIGTSHWIDERSVSVRCASVPDSGSAEQEMQGSSSGSTSFPSSTLSSHDLLEHKKENIKKSPSATTLLFAIDTGTTTVSRITVDTTITLGSHR
uniref:EF-hand domain-containing protein n=2 Tax=Lotharella globosa TaxID=91324 RepID=A0A7S3YCT9_9EUKA|mmetsp:Transcript_1517/g.2909  ORF Transcript_1517/g.2909 Transcript_1517/m.2909 type:complete len:317 (+) Transcript_1517:74-1024(+)